MTAPEHDRTLALRTVIAQAAENDPGSGRHRRHRIAIAAVPAAVILAAVSGGLFFAQAPVSDTMTVACFARAERNGSEFPGTTGALATQDGIPGSGDQVPIPDAIAFCSDLWRQGALDVDTANGSPVDLRPGQIPSELTVCVMPDGIAAVIPGTSDVCGQLGLANRVK
ncbi:hypothetical protein C5C95_05755 [Rathayibacter sp. AY1B7]|jgi:hypothetical protein|nr:hypothetical protein C5C54_14570 [Rathayibacter sp. AY1F2]PPF71975.1 hypothetical protein C5C46_08560 [Rathayibacter sp. AY1E6]PPH00143.1 hypothetical protein C5C44_15865 [Rathayibacter sp. AY1F6]PPH16191.1 hypothetical protein C5C35_11415 [Rathayibacter sp. AY1F8]PPH43666.1 hypothetical protein C5C42_13295 [Rathayibacter sp. AY1F7]PPH76966.1 hypothetical protein C5C90_04425 [Rathayibacter sp. AY1D4]PPH85041.1 hypothetical protein C5C64_17095 [Rathayibacter sp. AY1D3]PPI00078.1 hypothetic